MRLIDADMGREKLQEIYNAWNLAMAPAEGREIAYVDKKMRLCELMIKFLDQLPTIPPTPNAPLTSEELREMNGDPVWWEDKYGRTGYGIVSISEFDKVIYIVAVNRTFVAIAHGEMNKHLGLTLFLRKPEEGMT